MNSNNIEVKFKDINIKINDKKILNNVSFEVKKGDCVAILGANGEGKTTILKALMGNYTINIESGSIYINETLVNKLTTNERTQLGLFMVYQNPIEIEGIALLDFYRSIMTANHKKMNTLKMYQLINEQLKKVGLSQDFLKRELNCGFSGGEKKRNEIVQMLLINPQIILIDEIDSGLDVDSLNVILKILNEQKKLQKTIIFITHNIEVLQKLKPNKVLLVANNSVVHQGDYEFGLKTLQNGFIKTLQELNIKVEKKEQIKECLGAHFGK